MGTPDCTGGPGRDGKTALDLNSKHSTTHYRGFSVVSLKIYRAVPHDSPPPPPGIKKKKKDNTTGRDYGVLKMLTNGPLLS